MASQITTLLIDLDGTLLGTHTRRLERLFIWQFVSSLRSEGLSFWASLKILHLLKLKMREAGHQKNNVNNWNKATAFFSQLTGKSQEESDRILTATAIHCFQKASASFYSLRDAVDFIKWARSKYKLVLATNPLWPLDSVLYRLSLTEISRDAFHFITHAGNMSACKPHVHYYEELLEKLAVKPEECFMIGNDEKKDGPARELGIEVFILGQQNTFSHLRTMLEKK